MTKLTEQRVAKLEAIRGNDDGHFPYRFEVSHTVAGFLEDFPRLLETGEPVSLAGRVMLRNKMGKLVFIRAGDETGRVQWMISRQDVREDLFDLAKRKLDIGDICGVRGTAFRTKTGEASVLVHELIVLTKCIRALPEKYHGLKDKEVRYRQREVDLIMNQQVFATFKTRSRVVSFIRRWMQDYGFDEVETPILQMVYGGAEAAPFKTHVNAIGAQAYLSISPELFLKRLIVGGFNKVFTLSKNFRNEGIDATHYPEFTSLESYEAFADYNDVMSMTEGLLHDLCVEVCGSTTIEYQERRLSFERPFRRIRYFEALREKTGLDKESRLHDVLRFVKTELGDQEIDLTLDKARLLDKIFGLTVEPELIQPTFVTDYPRESSPLCREKRGDSELIERFELYIMAMEVANAYSELNDAVLQRRLLTEQCRLSSQNEEIPPEPDEDFMRSIEYGMPPTGGLGLGIDRIVMFLTNAESIRDVILFPFMRQEAPGSGAQKRRQKEVSLSHPVCEAVPATLKLFHKDMYVSDFEATVVDIQRNLVWLDQTAFYPFSGGQAGDTGHLNGHPVVDTIPDKRNRDIIIHVMAEEPDFAVGDQVEGNLTWEKRYRTMRLHSASHIMEYFLLKTRIKLSRVSTLVNEERDASKYRVDHANETSVNKMIAEIEGQVNDFISAKRTIDLVEDEAGYREWICGDIREGCGGTHVKNTTEIGPLRLTHKIEKGHLTVITELLQ